MRAAGGDAVRRKAQTPESALLGLCLDYLGALGIFSIRFNTGAVKIGTRFIRFGTAGCADVLACPVGQMPVWLEMKATTRQRPAQRAFQLAVEDAGHRYSIIESREDLKAVLGA